MVRFVASHALVSVLLVVPCAAGTRRPASPPPPIVVNPNGLRQAIEDLAQAFGPSYPNGEAFLTRLDAVAKQPPARRQAALRTLQREALLANPLLAGKSVLVVRRRCSNMWKPGFPSNHECNSSLPRTGYDNDIAILNIPSHLGGGTGRGTRGEQSATIRTLYRPGGGGYVGEVDLHWDADRMLFCQSDKTNWKVWEINSDGTDLRQVSQMPNDVDAFDPCYLPNGRIVFGSTASYQSVPCWHGQRWVSNLYVMDADGSGVRRLCYDQDHDFHPTIRSDGTVLYHRWDYTGINHIYMRQLMVMNPDGTGQRAVYGSNSWYPNSLYFPRELPGQPGRLACILSGYHGAHRMGQFVLVDTRTGSHGKDGIVQRISGRGDPIEPRVSDVLIDKDWPKFVHPWPLSSPSTALGAGKYFLVSCWLGGTSSWAIYLADVFDNLTLLHEQRGYALLEPVLLERRPTPPVLAERVDLARKDAVVYLHNVYRGPGLDGVPLGTIKRLRVIAYHFGYRHMAGPDKIGYGGPWEAMRIIGTVPVDADGSVTFRAPANTPLAVQALDAAGKAVQLMRSWFTLMPGEVTSCVGCHEKTQDAVPTRLSAAAGKPPIDITPWRGPARGFDFEREVQPVLDAHCVRCHDGSRKAAAVARYGTDTYPLKRGTPDPLVPVGAAFPDLRAERFFKDYQGQQLSKLGSGRMHPKLKAETGGRIRYTPAYDALLPYVRRVSIEDDVSLLIPGEYHADTSELIQLLRAGHYGVELDAEAWDRLITWIDLNAPCHGTWSDVHQLPTNAKGRRAELRRLYGPPPDDPETVVPVSYEPQAMSPPKPAVKPVVPKLNGWPFDADEAKRRQTGQQHTVDLGGGVRLDLAFIPAGTFVMGSADGCGDEAPPTAVTVGRPFWMGTGEVTNEQFRRFDPGFDPRYYARLHARSDDQGLPLDGATQPAIRVSWHQAMAYCIWLSERTGRPFTLPTEAQWEWACRAGTETPLNYGKLDADFSKHANVADRAYADVKNVTGGLAHLIIHGQALCDARFTDRHRVTAPVGSYQPNAWGLHDLHGNAAEWTLSLYRPYPYADDGRNGPSVRGRRVVRGGSFFERPKRCRSSARLAYPPWQRVFNVGFRVVCLEDPAAAKRAGR